MRTQLTDQQINDGIRIVLDKLQFRLSQKGYGTFASTHEILGILEEEYKEFVDAIHDGNYIEVKSELVDIAVGAIFGVVCLEAKTIDW
jgi:hypothetical protein